MKDKLIKNNRKSKFYRFKKAMMSFSIFLGCSIIIAAPLSISIAAIQALADNVTSVPSENISVEEVVSV